ncbi:MAG: hypothetical protein GXO25_01255 [Euryarchaeota archaeon]|nr:hypothetical protein [Euryarchaeota archaeon]
MNDMRDKVERERTLLKKIELAIPGFRGYRKREDLRIADSLLRDYIARILDDAHENLKEVRENLSRNMALDEMSLIGRLINNMVALKESVRHAEQGYMGLVSDYRVDTDQLNRLYEFDVKLIEEVQALRDYAVKMAEEENIHELHRMMKQYLGMMKDFNSLFRTRRNKMLGVFR